MTLVRASIPVDSYVPQRKNKEGTRRNRPISATQFQTDYQQEAGLIRRGQPDILDDDWEARHKINRRRERKDICIYPEIGKTLQAGLVPRRRLGQKRRGQFTPEDLSPLFYLCISPGTEPRAGRKTHDNVSFSSVSPSI